jgi:cytochrome c oxidase assembly protein subunit 15
MMPLAIWVLVLGTIATGSGPHPGTHGNEVATRFSFRGGDTMNWIIHWHGRFSTLFGLSAVALWFFLRRQNAGAPVRRAVTALCLLLAAQGIVGFVQYATELPAGVVWVHVCLATLTWLSVVWVVAAAGRLAPAGEREEHSSHTRPEPTAPAQAPRTVPAVQGAGVDGAERG